MANEKIAIIIAAIGYGIIALFMDNQMFDPVGEFKNSLLRNTGILALLGAGIGIVILIVLRKKK